MCMMFPQESLCGIAQQVMAGYAKNWYLIGIKAKRKDTVVRLCFPTGV
jgi:hypothetical protein